eukprot:TRINITY_DN16764_c0_g1_i1.p2 TRINITY_DN16764_c0_g1~~TRINITY_DN16764_c0_g1_i1.p2  ORF type:complete len:52 (-),score=8.15 TRINITY_DN16764_c0_g1_i1:171-326(-)
MPPPPPHILIAKYPPPSSLITPYSKWQSVEWRTYFAMVYSVHIIETSKIKK